MAVTKAQKDRLAMTDSNNVVHLDVAPVRATVGFVDGGEPAFDAFSALVETLVAKAKKQQEVQQIAFALKKAEIEDVQLHSEAQGMLKAMGHKGSVQEALQTNWRGIADTLKERIK